MRRNKKHGLVYSVLSLLVVIVLLLSGDKNTSIWDVFDEASSILPEINNVNQGSETSVAVRVVDGDTIELNNGEKVRYIGVDAPESVKPGIEVQCYAKEAFAENQRLVLGKEVRLVKDTRDRDRYGRLLRYVFVGDTMINEKLVRGGFAKAKAYPPDTRYQDLFFSAEKVAKAEDRGLWGKCGRFIVE